MKGALASPVAAAARAGAAMQEGFGCVVANRFHQLLDDESDPFDILREAERRREQQQQQQPPRKRRDEAAGTRGCKSPAGAPAGHRAGAAAGGRRESQKERKGPPAPGPQRPVSPGTRVGRPGPGGVQGVRPRDHPPFGGGRAGVPVGTPTPTPRRYPRTGWSREDSGCGERTLGIHPLLPMFGGCMHCVLGAWGDSKPEEPPSAKLKGSVLGARGSTAETLAVAHPAVSPKLKVQL